MDLCFYTKHELTWGSSRERIGQYKGTLEKRGHTFTAFYAIPNKLSKAWIGGKSKTKLCSCVYSFWYSRIVKNFKFLRIILSAKRYHIIVIQKVTVPYILVWLLKVRNKNIIFDFDDSCFWNPDAEHNKRISLRARVSFLRQGLQHPSVLRLYRRVIAGNRYLYTIAAGVQQKERISLIPTAINCAVYTKKEKVTTNNPLVIGWAGTGENHLKHLGLLVNPLKTLAQKYEFNFKIIGAMSSPRIKQLFGFLGPALSCVDWVDIDSLPAVIRTFDLGVMPLAKNEQAMGKCGFKALQYMASGVPVVISPIGVNAEIVKDGVNGFLAESESEWTNKIAYLLKDLGLRQKFISSGRATVEELYSLDKTTEAFVAAIENP